MTKEELAEIRRRYSSKEDNVYQLIVEDIPRLLAEVERLQREIKLWEEVAMIPVKSVKDYDA